MLRSKSRSGSSDFGPKRHSSLISRIISASKCCRGDPLVSQIDREALISIDRKPSKILNFSENRINRVSKMQYQMGLLEEELKRTREQFGVAKRELGIKDKNIEYLNVELEKAKHFELKFREREESLDRFKEELSNSKASEARGMGLLSGSKKRIHELEAEVERGKLSESQLFDSFVSQTKQLEQTNIELEESKLEISSLHEQMEKLQISSRRSSRDSMKEPFNGLKSELQLAKENLAHAQDGEKFALLKAESLLAEMGSLRSELKLATDAEEKSKKAMDDLALALKEVATKANQTKEKLTSTQLELEHVKGEAEQLKEMVRMTEDRYQNLLDKAKKETEQYQNTLDRLRMEAEESLLAWNGKEMGFVNCIKRADEERALAQRENTRLIESLKAAEDMTRTAREDSYKLRDILKQALNEANVAKVAASIARDENSQLKDSLADKDEALHFLTRENELLRINEAAAHVNIKELKRLLSAASMELKIEDNKQGGMLKSPNLLVEEGNKWNTVFSSIFDGAVSPKSEPHTPKSGSHHLRGSSPFTDDRETINSEDFDHLEGTHFDGADGDRSNHRKSRSALLRRLGDLIMRRSFHKKEPSME